MNKNILFFSVNRHQKIYFDYLLATVKAEDNGLSLHQRELVSTFPDLYISPADLKLVREICSIRAQYSENKSGMKASKFKRILYFITSMFFLLKIKKLLSNNNFDIILLWNDMKWHQAIIKNIAAKQHIKTAFFENGALPNTVTFDNKGVNYNNSVPRNREFYLTNGLVGEHQLSDPAVLEMPCTNTGYIFAPFQVDYDTQIISHSPWLNNMEEFYYLLETLVKSLPEGMKIYVKEHPASSRCYQHLGHVNSRIEFKNDNDTAELITNAELIITINSTVGLEGIVKNKPVVVLGNAFYSIDGLCCHAENEQELLNKVQKRLHPDSIVRSSFLYYLSNEYYVRGNWRSPTKEHLEAIGNRLYGYLQQ